MGGPVQAEDGRICPFPVLSVSHFCHLKFGSPPFCSNLQITFFKKSLWCGFLLINAFFNSVLTELHVFAIMSCIFVHYFHERLHSVNTVWLENCIAKFR